LSVDRDANRQTEPLVCRNRARFWRRDLARAVLVGLSSDPVKRQAQLANLRATAAVKHGADSAAARQLAERYLAELVEEFPSASERVLRIQARRLAKLDRLATYLETVGEIRHRRRGEVYPASALEEKIAAAYLAEHERLAARESGAADPEAALHAVVAELAAARENGEHDDGTC
jgi:CRP-like cAMP-binding protein